MSPLFKRTSVLGKRLKKIRKELLLIHCDIRSLSKTVEEPGTAFELPRVRSESSREPGRTAEVREAAAPVVGTLTDKPGSSREGEEPGRQGHGKPRTKGHHIRDERFTDYLASSFQTVRPLRRERRIQRNKAIVMVIFVLLALFWGVYRFYL